MLRVLQIWMKNMSIIIYGNIKKIEQFKGKKLEGKPFSSNVINFSKRVISEVKISLLSKGLKFVLIAFCGV